VTHIEIMPVAAFAGDRGWGYDGVAMFAVTENYGGPDAMKRFVDACHANGLAVLLDVVYNHFGPVGNYTGMFGPYVTDRHRTPWGDAINFEEEGSDEVRRFFCDNALMWMRDFHCDGLRLDAVHEFNDRSAVNFMEQLSAEVEVASATLGRRLVLIAESDLNDPRIVTPREAGGYGMDAQWSDDFHHALFSILNPDEGGGYYEDFGTFDKLAKSLTNIFVYDGIYSKYRKRHHGRQVVGLSAHHFIGFIQDHDQVGNRATGDRLEHVIGMEKSKVAIGIVLAAPFIPMIFQGEEFAASTPFQYFADHDDEEMAKLVSAGRKREFAAFGWEESSIPDPEKMETFQRSKLNWHEAHQGVHAEMLDWYTQLIHIRRSTPSLNDGDPGRTKVLFDEEKQWLSMERGLVLVLVNLGAEPVEFDVSAEARLIAQSRPEIAVAEGKISLPTDTLAVLSCEESPAGG
jgi:maltooligosyltrehalose trehalohydrolase